MGFIIDNKSIDFQDYKNLDAYKEAYPIVTDIIPFLTTWYSLSTIKFKMTTSGSTATPKEVVHSRQAMKTSAKLTAEHFKFCAGQMALLCLPVKFIAGKMMLVRCIESELNLVITEPSSRPLKSNTHLIDFAAMTPHQFMCSTIGELRNCKTILLGGGPVNQTLIERCVSNKLNVFHGFGMTETLTHIALKNLNVTENLPYKILPSISIQTDDRNCLVISASHFEKVITNDIVQILDKGSFLWKGRYDNVINSGGLKLYPEQIESRLSTLIDAPFFISSESDDILGERLVICIESDDSEYENLVNAMKNLLSVHEIPKRLYLCSMFKRTKTGKIQRKLTLKKIRNNSQ